jgi:anti-sigma factor RsiW
MDGHEVERYVELSLDGELEPADEAEFHALLAQQPETRRFEKRERCFQSQLRARLREASSDNATPAELRTRVLQRIRTEDMEVRARPWGRAVAATLAVSALIIVSWSGSGLVLDPEEPVAKHSQNRPPEIRARGNPAEATQFFEKHLGVPVPVPRLERAHPHVRLVGVRLDSISNQDAAYFMYDHRGARISVFAVPGDRRWSPPPSFRPRTVGDHMVSTGQHRGYNVLAFDRGPLQYFMVSDVDSDQLVELATGF